MSWFNYIGLIIILIMMIPNMICAKLHPEEFENHFSNKRIEMLEQIGRIGSFILMIFNIPVVCRGFFFESDLLIYIIGNAVLLALYILGWFVFKFYDPVQRAIFLSVVPSVLFIFSGVILLNIPLIVFAILFAIFHIFISVKNAEWKMKNA